MTPDQILNNTLITSIVNLVVGKVLKNNLEYFTKFIPWINYILNVLINAGIGILVPSAHAASVSGVASGVFGWFANPFVLGLLQMLISTGIHSTAKNTREAFLVKKV